MRAICLVPALLLAVSTQPAGSAGSAGNVRHYAIDTKASTVDAKVPFLAIAAKTARFPEMNGTLALDIDRYPAVDMTVNIDARKLTTGDSETKRLRGPQFFDVARHPTVTFHAEKLELTGERSATVSGQMTAKGVTRPVSLAITFSQSPYTAAPDQPLSFTGTTTIDRRRFNMGAFPLVIGNQVAITIKARMVPA